MTPLRRTGLRPVVLHNEEDKDGPEKYKLNKDAAVTVLVYKKSGAVTKSFAFKDTKSAAEKAKEISTAAEEAVK